MSYHVQEPDPAYGGKVTHIIRESDGGCIPVDPKNVDFQEFLRWNAEQETPLDYGQNG